MKIRFYLKDKKTAGKTMIILSFHYNGKRLKYSTGISVKPKSWSTSSKQIYSGVSSSVIKNATLKKMEYLLSEEYNTIVHDNDDIPETDYFKKLLNSKFKNLSQTDSNTFFDYFDEFVKKKKEIGADIRKYNSLKKHLSNIEKTLKIKLSFKTFSEQFYETFIDYFVGLGQANQSIKDKHLKAIKTFLNWCVYKGYTKKNNFTGKKFPYPISKPHHIALTEKQVRILHELDLTANIRLQNIRDIFLLECYTGVRFSDIKKITPENIKEEELYIYTDKTATNNVEIPLRPVALEIINRYHSKGKDIPLKSNKTINKYIKEIGEIAGFDDTITWVVTSGRNMTEHMKKGFQKLIKAGETLQTLKANSESTLNIEEIKTNCYKAMNDDFNSPILIAHLFEAVRIINLINDGKESINNADLDNLKSLFNTFVFDVLGLKADTGESNDSGLTGDLIDMILNLRLDAKKNKDFATSDKIRDELTNKGVVIKDTKDGFEWEI